MLSAISVFALGIHKKSSLSEILGARFVSQCFISLDFQSLEEEDFLTNIELT